MRSPEYSEKNRRAALGAAARRRATTLALRESRTVGGAISDSVGSLCEVVISGFLLVGNFQRGRILWPTCSSVVVAGCAYVGMTNS